MHKCVYTHIYVYIHMYICIYVYVLCIPIYIYVYTYVYIYIYVHAPPFLQTQAVPASQVAHRPCVVVRRSPVQDQHGRALVCVWLVSFDRCLYILPEPRGSKKENPQFWTRIRLWCRFRALRWIHVLDPPRARAMY